MLPGQKKKGLELCLPGSFPGTPQPKRGGERSGKKKEEELLDRRKGNRGRERGDASRNGK